MPSKPETIYLGLGSNLGDREASIARALELLRSRLTLTEVSSLYETEPVGYRDQPPFLNAVCFGSTLLEPLELLAAVKEIEDALGRVPTIRHGPRVIDIDILLYADLVMDSPTLTIPHPRMAERAFVLVPLVEIEPGVMHPSLGKKYAELLADMGERDGVKLFNPRMGRQLAPPEVVG
ncbi:MAG: 2-amino-4-hydroxy-6-hydroxymethyldihydropteridine pyrophosphokinase [Dehalococcoidia bacterium]|nr:2-amino-4-hydroxy-6-hydroxymethyldihydropteridine pyrophosphokinase [Dehalococcoidia bacterium]